MPSVSRVAELGLNQLKKLKLSLFGILYLYISFLNHGGYTKRPVLNRGVIRRIDWMAHACKRWLVKKATQGGAEKTIGS
jgi:hypothetical protein